MRAAPEPDEFDEPAPGAVDEPTLGPLEDEAAGLDMLLIESGVPTMRTWRLSCARRSTEAFDASTYDFPSAVDAAEAELAAPDALLAAPDLAFSRMNTVGLEPCTRHPVNVISWAADEADRSC